MSVRCPHCQSEEVRFSRRRTVWDRILHVFGLYRFRCEVCGQIFQANIYDLQYLPYAKCPGCHRMDLGRWSRDYYSAPLWTRMMLGCGAKPVRCAYCRINFWSFRFVREKFDKRKRAARSQVVIPAGGGSPDEGEHAAGKGATGLPGIERARNRAGDAAVGNESTATHR